MAKLTENQTHMWLKKNYIKFLVIPHAPRHYKQCEQLEEAVLQLQNSQNEFTKNRAKLINWCYVLFT